MALKELHPNCVAFTGLSRRTAEVPPEGSWFARIRDQGILKIRWTPRLKFSRG